MATRAYAIVGFNDIYVSDDLGVNWSQATAAGLPTSPFTIGATRVWIDTDTHDPYKTLVANQSYGIYRSVDGGESYTLSGNTAGHQWHSVYYLDSFNVLAIGDQLFKSTDGGQNFTALPVTASTLYGVPGSIARAAYFPAGTSGFVAIEDKVYKTTDFGNTWEVLNGDAPIVAGYRITGIVSDGLGEIISVLCGAGVYQSTDSGNTFSLLGTPGALGGSPVADFRFSGTIENTGVVFLICDLGIYKSTNSGSTWVLVNGALTGVDNIDIFDFTSSKVIVGDDTTLYASSDGGVTLTNPFIAGKITAITGVDFLCGECRSKYDFNPATGNCEQEIEGLSLCGAGFTYNPVTGNCEALSGGSCEVDLIITLDNSGSVQNEPAFPEWTQMKLLAEDIVNSLSAQITSGDIQVGIVQWASSACVSQELTTNITDITIGINQNKTFPSSGLCSGSSIGGGTDHVDAICAAQNELFSGATARPLAAKVIITITDGTGCSGPCVYNTVSYSNLSGYIDLCDALKTDGVKHIMVGLGESIEVSSIYSTFINIATPVVTVENGTPLWFEASFSGASSIAGAVSDSVCGGSYAPPACPPGCTLVYGPDESDPTRLIARCKCLESLTVVPCCYELADCKGSAQDIITQVDLSDYIEKIVKIQGSDVCWTVTKLDDICPTSTVVTIVESFDECFLCDPSYALYNCKDNDVVIYTTQNLEADLSKTVQVSEYPGECWQVGPNTKTVFTPEEITKSQEFQSCAICNPPLYQLNNCFNEQSFIITDTDLLGLIGKTISIKGYPGLCFTVTEPTCKCLRVTGIFDTQTGIEETIDVNASDVLINGRYQYIFTANGITYSIVWNNDPAQWEFYNVTDNQLISYNPIDTPCPYSGYWPQFTLPVTYTYVLTDSFDDNAQNVDVSFDNGMSYQTYFVGVPTSGISGAVIRADQNRAGYVYVASDGSGIFYSSLFGTNWTQSGGTYDDTANYINLHVMYETAIPSLIAVGDKFAISTDGGLTYSNTTDTPATLYPTWPGPDTRSYCVTSFGNTIYVGVEDKIFKTANNGVTWTACNADTPVSANEKVRAITTLSSTNVIAVTTDGIYLSTDAGLTFGPQLTITPYTGSAAIYNVDNNTIYVYFAKTTGLVYKSTNGGISWSLVSSGPYGGDAIDIPFYDTQLGIIGGREISPYRTTNGGSAFTATGALSGKLVSIDYATYTQGCYPFCSLLVKTESCSDLIYDIVVDEVFPDCECCITKNCK